MTKGIPEALDAFAEAAVDLALAYRLENSLTTPQDAPGAAPATTTAPTFEELPFDEYDSPQAEVAAVTATPHGSAAVCPKHGKAYAKGRYGLYCQSPSDEPEWRNDKGFCRITPRNADVWMRQKAAA